MATCPNSQNAEIAALQVQVETLQAVIGSQEVNPDVIQASSVLFAVTFAAAAVVWGLKRVYAIINEQSAGHE